MKDKNVKEINTQYGKVLSIRLKNKTIKQMEELKAMYSELFGFQLTNSDLLKILINKELKLHEMETI